MKNVAVGFRLQHRSHAGQGTGAIPKALRRFAAIGDERFFRHRTQIHHPTPAIATHEIPGKGHRMMKKLASVLFCALHLCGGAQASEPLKLTATIALPGVKGRFDHFSYDAAGHRLFVAALGNDTVEVVDTAAGRRLKTIGGLHEPTGVLYLAARNQIAVAGGGDGTLKVFDGVKYALLKTVDSLDDADNLRFDAGAQRIYLGYGSGALTIIDSAAMRLVGEIKLAAHPESFQLEQAGRRIFVNVPDARQIAVLDRDTRIVTAKWPTEPFHANFPMALDEAGHRLFVGCRQPARLLVLDTATGKPVGDVVLSGDTDDLFYDVNRRRIYASCGEGFVDVIERQSSDRYQRRERIATRAGARTSFFDDSTGELFVAVPQRGREDAELRIFVSRP